MDWPATAERQRGQVSLINLEQGEVSIFVEAD
jgi:hypothetical protein